MLATFSISSFGGLVTVDIVKIAQQTGRGEKIISGPLRRFGPLAVWSGALGDVSVESYGVAVYIHDSG